MSTILERFKEKLGPDSPVEDIITFLRAEDETILKNGYDTYEVMEYYDYIMDNYLDLDKYNVILKAYEGKNPLLIEIAEHTIEQRQADKEKEELKSLDPAIYNEAKCLAKLILERGHTGIIMFRIGSSEEGFQDNIEIAEPCPDFNEDEVSTIIYRISAAILTQGMVVVQEHLPNDRYIMYGWAVTDEHHCATLKPEAVKLICETEVQDGKLARKDNWDNKDTTYIAVRV